MLAAAARFAIGMLFVVVLASCLPCASAEQTWREVQSPHFRVLTDSSEKDGRAVAFRFEQMHHVFATFFRNDHLSGGAALTIFAPRDAATFRQLEPHLSPSQDDSIAGLFYEGWEHQYAITRMDTWQDQNEVVAFHEYTHSVLHANTFWLPVWLDEGMAEFYAYTRFENTRILVGRPTARMRELQRKALLPVATMLQAKHNSAVYADPNQQQLFYAEAWAMVHYMMFGPGMNNGQKLVTFIQKLQNREPQEQAFREIFGELPAFDQALDQYTSGFLFNAGVLPPDEKIDPQTFTARVLTPAEVHYEIGSFQEHLGDDKDARAALEQALQQNPKLAPAHEELGYLLFGAGEDAQAKEQWNEAVFLDPTLHRSLYMLALSDKTPDQQSPEERNATEQTLQHVTALAPRFAPAFVELALLEWRDGKLQQAYKDAHQAELLEPWRIGYRTLTGNILLAGKQPTVAAQYAQFVAGHTIGSDRNEAVLLWEQIPKESRGNAPELNFDFTPGAQLVRGRLTSISCNAAPDSHDFTVTVQPDNSADTPPITLHGKSNLWFGFSDTFWWGSDHFNRCHHTANLPVLVTYKPGAGPIREVIDIQVLENLPKPLPQKTASSASASVSAKASAVLPAEHNP